MSIPATAENTMFKKVENENNNNNNNNNNNCEKIEIEKIEIEKIEIEKKENDSTIEQNETICEEMQESDDDMIVITVRETYTNETNQPLPPPPPQPQLEEKAEEEKPQPLPLTQTNEEEEKEKKQPQIQTNEEEKKAEEFFSHLKDEMESKKLFPLMPCNMVSAFGYAMQHVEYLDITNAERKAMATELVKCLAYSNNEHGARECFDYLFQNNMTDNIIKTIIDCTKDRYDINKYPHTNRNIVLSCVSLSKKVKKTTKPKLELLEDLFDFEFKFNFCDLKRFFKIKDGSKSV
jgi:hypothetical protein